MLFASVAALLSLASAASAHYTLQEPYWRGNSLEGNASQWVYPCAGISQTESDKNRTAWPLTGGSVKAKFGHEWAITYINLGLGEVVTGFNISLLADYNQTGTGEFCLPQVGGDALAGLDIKNGTKGSVQVVQISHSGGALYNCADIVFTDDAKLLSDDVCKNGTGVSGHQISAESSNLTTVCPEASGAAAVGPKSVVAAVVLLAGLVAVW